MSKLKDTVSKNITSTYVGAVFRSMSQLQSGMGTAANGASQLYAGAGALQSGSQTLPNGLGTLAGSTQTLAAGVNTLSSGAICLYFRCVNFVRRFVTVKCEL